MYKLSEMENEALLKQWEPKVFSMLRRASIRGMELEDIAQELRIVILRAASRYDVRRGASFHTYLHTALVNRIRTLITKAQGHQAEGLIDDLLCDTVTDQRFSIDRLNVVIGEVELSHDEKKMLTLLLSGYNLNEIKRFGLITTDARKVHKSLQKKFNFLRANG